LVTGVITSISGALPEKNTVFIFEEKEYSDLFQDVCHVPFEFSSSMVGFVVHAEEVESIFLSPNSETNKPSQVSNGNRSSPQPPLSLRFFLEVWGVSQFHHVS